VIRVVADANVLVSAAPSRSPLAPSALVLDAALDGRLEPLSSPMLLTEITSAVGLRPRAPTQAGGARRPTPVSPPW
jgi:predicted nucleic acid-binding protein